METGFVEDPEQVVDKSRVFWYFIGGGLIATLEIWSVAVAVLVRY